MVGEGRVVKGWDHANVVIACVRLAEGRCYRLQQMEGGHCPFNTGCPLSTCRSLGVVKFRIVSYKYPFTQVSTNKHSPIGTVGRVTVGRVTVAGVTVGRGTVGRGTVGRGTVGRVIMSA